MTHAEKIMDAIIFGGEKKPHPLSKSPCGFCGANITEKDMESHLETFHFFEGDRSPRDYDEPELSTN